MSDFGKHGTQKALNASASVAINKFMAEDTAATLTALRNKLQDQEAVKHQGADI